MLSVQSLYENQNIEEGIIRGLATTQYRSFRQMMSQFAMFKALLKDPLGKVKHIEQTLDSWSKKFASMNIDLKDSNHEILKGLDKLVFWRFYVILNDEFYKKCIKDVIERSVGKNIWVDINFKDREIPMVYNIKSSDDIIKILNTYKKRVNEVYQLSLKHPDKAKQFGAMINFGLFGLLDLFNVIHSVISYGSKGL